ncbi:hypothetical protein [Duganella hordei]|uniref:hypothetical protein n=1 Tax=Duganella hordei TaxID=2865934 RepID=UPI0033423CE5
MRAGILLMLCWLAGCTTPLERPYDYAQGWRVAVVGDIGPGPAGLAAGLDCRTPGSRSAYAYVQYYSRLRQRHAIVMVAEGSHLRVGQQVYVNIRDCTQAAVALAHGSPY